MPELPEVETIKNELEPHLVGRSFSEVSLEWPPLVKHPSPEEFCHQLTGWHVTGLNRRGKYLIIRLEKRALIVHLRMTGALLLNPPQPDPWARARFRLDDGSELVFSDRRKLGALWLVEDKKEVVGKLGPEPLAPSFTAGVLAQRLRGRKAPIKALLLDQGFLAGVGNMYADEALWAARIHPLRAGKGLSPEEEERLFRAIRQVLKTAIGNKGASISTYRRPGGEQGTAHFEFKVAHKGGQPCPRCSTPLQRLALRNRGSYFCPRCQV
ncbi:MAG: bifunctional DNA-formamidopyrimidine glycosylase/DNA-(apurinic or apyrimidinic site) lyase [Dehalococcoidia bacterium]